MPNKRIHHRTIDFSVDYHTDSNGLRVTTDNEEEGLKINIYGDSFAFGVGLSDEETAASLLSKMLSPARVSNLGVSGYSPDQYYLKFSRDINEPTLRPDLAVFFILPANDMLEINRPYQAARQRGNWHRTKPLLAKNATGYEFIFPKAEAYTNHEKNKSNGKYKSLVLNLLDKSALLHFVYNHIMVSPQLSFSRKIVRNFNSNHLRLRVKNETIESGLARFEWCVTQISQSGVRTIYLLIPSENLMLGVTHGGREDIAYQRTKELLTKKNVLFIDMLDIIPKKRGYYWHNEGHWSQKGAELAAKALLGKITELEILRR